MNVPLPHPGLDKWSEFVHWTHATIEGEHSEVQNSESLSKEKADIIYIIESLFPWEILNNISGDPSVFVEELSPEGLKTSLRTAIVSHTTWNIVLQRMACLVLSLQQRVTDNSPYFDTSIHTFSTQLFERNSRTLLNDSPTPFSHSTRKFITHNFISEFPVAKWKISHTFTSRQQLSINRSLYALSAAIKSAIVFHHEVYKEPLPAKVMRCLELPSYPVEYSPKTLNFQQYPEALTLLQGICALFPWDSRPPQIVELVKYLGTVSIWNWCFKNSAHIQQDFINLEVFPLLHLWTLALEHSTHYHKLTQKDASRHRYDILTALGYPEKIQFVELAPLREPPISSMTEGFKFEDRRLLLELIARARVRFYDTVNVRNSLLGYLRNSPEKLEDALTIIKSGKIGSVLTNAQLILLLEKDIALSSIRLLGIENNTVTNIESILRPFPQTPVLKLVASSKKIHEKPTIPLVSPKKNEPQVGLSPENIQAIRMRSLATILGIPEEIFPVPDTLLSTNLIDQCFTLSKRGKLWGKHNLDLIEILAMVWTIQSIQPLTIYITKLQALASLSTKTFVHDLDQKIIEALKQKNANIMSELANQSLQDYQMLQNSLSPQKLSSTGKWSSNIGSGGFAVLLSKVLEYLSPSKSDSSEQILLKILNFSWADKRLGITTLGKGFNQANLQIIGRLPKTVGFYSATSTLANTAKTINIGGQGNGATVGAAIRDIVHTWDNR